MTSTKLYVKQYIAKIIILLTLYNCFVWLHTFLIQYSKSEYFSENFKLFCIKSNLFKASR